MDICDVEKPFPYLKIKNYFNEKELELIWEELKFLTYKEKLEPPHKTGQINPNMKNNAGLYLDNIYTNRNYSNILNVTRKTFSLEIIKSYKNLNMMNEIVLLINNDSTLVSYYENEGYYKSHSDNSVITALIWLFKEPKKFEGGDLIFTDYNEKIKIENNMFVMFPSFVKHEVTAVTMNKSIPNFSGYGRYCISQFMNISS
jgi:Rps23 Pro-64 3,4-dihydroxylase Tpa1-like proline 4-hydroxylase